MAELLHELDYSLQANRKTREGSSHPDRNAQFEHINRRIQVFQQRGQPVVSVDTKKKELIGDFRNGGQEWQPKGSPEPVWAHDFIDKKLGKAIPYGVYDVAGNRGWVSVGADHDTAEFATETIHRWWRHMGSLAYPRAKELLILADGGGGNSSRTRLWKIAYSDWPTRPESLCRCATSRREPASGTRFSTACFPISRRTGEVDRLSATR